MAKVEINNVKNRFLPIPESVAKGLEPEAKISDFNIVKELGAGSFGHVYLVTHKTTKVHYAIKAIDKRNKTNIEEKPYFRREVEVMYKIHHPNVVKLFGHFEDNNYCYFIMEYISKGNVYGLIPTDKKKRLSAQVVASIIKDVISAVYFLHNMNPPIIHRDIKPENVLLAEGLVAKLTDFGWSNYMQEDEKRTTVCGTPIYLAPEIIKEKGHDERVDIWCIGVLLFELVTGNVPFQGTDIETLKNNILRLKIAWPRDINTDAKNLIMKILKLDPNARLPLNEMLSHPFFAKYFPNASQSLITPNENIKYKPFVVCKDDPKTWDPISQISEENPPNPIAPTPTANQTSANNPINNIPKPQSNPQGQVPTQHVEKPAKQGGSKHNSRGVSPKGKSPKKDICTPEKFAALKEKYEKLKKEIVNLKGGEKVSNDIQSLKALLKEKEERVAQLVGLIKSSGEETDDTYLKMKCDELEKENNGLKEKIVRYEQFVKEQQAANIDNRLKELRDSMSGNNQANFKSAMENLKSHLDSETKKNLNEIIKEKDKEIQKIKDDEKIRREKEKKKFTTIINKYDKTLSHVEKENKELKAKIKELQAKSAK